MPEYHNLTEDELLHLASEKDQLTDEARLALESELNQRKLSAAEVTAYARQFAEDKEAENLRGATPQITPIHGLSKKFFGKLNRRSDPSGLFELYESTLWFAVLWFPVYPIATYTVRCEMKRWLGMEFTSGEIAIERHPRNWGMVLWTWVKACAVLLLIRLVFLFWVRH